jgi:accessory gene regulator B
MAVFFVCIGRFPAYCLALGIMLPVRVFSGGFHMQTNIGCFIVSFCLLLFAVCVLPIISISAGTLIMIMLLANVLILFCAPVATNKKPIHTRKRYQLQKIKTVTSVIIDSSFLSFLLMQGEIYYLSVGVWILVLHSMQLLAAWIVNAKKGVFFYEKGLNK